MKNIDPTEALFELIKTKPFLKELIQPICAFLSQTADCVQEFENHLQSNLGYLEQSLKKPLNELRTAAVQKAVQQVADKMPAKCLKCDQKLTLRQWLERTVDVGSGEFRLKRLYGRCQGCGQWCCPVDERLQIESGYSPHVQEMAALFSSKLPIAEASLVLERATGIQMAPATLDRLVKQVAQKGLALRQKQDQQARQGGQALANQRVQKAPETLVILIDAWNIRERDDWGQSEKLRRQGQEPKRWHWVWTGTVFGLDKRLKKGKRAMITNRGYVATRQGIAGLSEQLHAEALRQGLGQAKRVIVLADGALWIWKLAGDRFQEAIQRVDLYHVKQHLWVVAKELYPQAHEAKAWVKKMKGKLRRGQAGQVIGAIEQAIAQWADKVSEPLKKELNYLKENQKRMDYASGLKRGEPVGSGAIESTCRQYQCRFKRTGQFWTLQGDEALMCLETLWRNQRWNLLFPHIEGFHPSKN